MSEVQGALYGVRQLADGVAPLAFGGLLRAFQHEDGLQGAPFLLLAAAVFAAALLAGCLGVGGPDGDEHSDELGETLTE